MEADVDIPVDHPSFAGHFPDQPIVPGVVLIDATLHAIAQSTGASLDRFALASVKFFHLVRPGEPITVEWAHQAEMLSFTLSVAGKAVATGSVTRVDLEAANER